MLPRLILLPCLFGLTFLCLCTAEDENTASQYTIPEITQDSRYNQPISDQVSQSVMNFAHDLAVAMDTDEYPNVQIFSPLSVMSALSLLQMGSYGNTFNQLNRIFGSLNNTNTPPSKIHEEFGWLLEDVQMKEENRRRLHKPAEWRSTPLNDLPFGPPSRSNDLEGHTIRVSNGLFVQNGFNLKPDYAFAAQSVYKSEVTLLDFRNLQKQSRDYINSWVNQNTLGKIPSIIENYLPSDTEMILASTLYFKGFWEKLFFEAWKHKEPFYPDGPDSFPVSVTYMGTGGTFPYYHSEQYDCRILGMPYKGNHTTMYVIQPIDSTRLKLQQLQKDLTGERLNELISKMEYTTATVVFPKFHLTSKMQLKKALKAMGIEDIFVNGAADFSLIADPEQGRSAAASASAASWGAIPVQFPQALEASGSSAGRPISAAFGSNRSPIFEALDRYNEAPLIFSRFSDDEPSNKTATTTDKPEEPKVETTTKSTESSTPKSDESSSEESKVPEEVVKNDMKRRRRRRQAIPESAQSLQRLDHLRATAGLKKPQLYVDEVLHTVDFNVNEQGTEAAAATLAYLTRSGPKVSMRCDAPFLILIRHDLTKLPLFYGIVNIPTNIDLTDSKNLQF